MEEEESKSSFLIKNLLKGLLYLAIIVVAFVYAEEYLNEHLKHYIQVLSDKPIILFGIFTISEIVFGLIPPVLFMSTWKELVQVTLTEYVIYMMILTVISFLCGVLGFYIGKYFSKTRFYKRIEEKYLLQYNKQLRRFGVFLVIVGALTPVPFSATCMLAGSVHTPFKDFIWACSTRVFYFLVYGWIAWSFPSLFS
jgi:membrane protein YqaA with SNARE-associated domain